MGKSFMLSVSTQVAMLRRRLFAYHLANTKWVNELAFYALALVVSFYYSQLRFGVVGVIPEASPYSLMAGTAQLPLQYRVLVPWCANLILGTLDLLPSLPEVSPESIFQYIELISLLLLVVSFRYLVSLFFSNRLFVSVLSFSVFYPLLFHYVLWRAANPFTYLQWFAWDIPSVMFITMGITLLYKKKWLSYYILFLLATFNRETTCFLTFIYLFAEFGKSKPKVIALHCFLQLVIWTAVKYFLFRLYLGNLVEGGSDYFSRGLFFAAEYYDGRNLATVTNIRLYPFLFGVIGYLWVPVVLSLRMIRDSFVKRSLLVIVPFYVGMFYVGSMTELRNYGELIPIVLLAFLLILREWLEREPYEIEHVSETGLRVSANNNLGR